MLFRWKGQSWTLRHASTIDLRVLGLASAGDLEAMRKALLTAMGAEQAKRFDEVDQDAVAMVKLFHVWTDYAGTPPGESPASSASSASTAKRSRPASRSTTRESGSASSGKAPSPRAS